MEDLFKTYKRNVALGINIDNLYYIYDRSSNNILEVSKYIYENLDYLSLFESSIENIFINKKLSANYFNQWIPKLNTLKQNIDNTLSELTLNITETCNFRCKYCFFNKKIEESYSKSMSLKTAKKAVDFYFKNSNNCNHQISFIGGEPLLKFNLIKKIVEYIKTFNNKVSFTIITNGSLLKEDILNYLIENMFHITISFDGEKEIQGLNRLSKDKKTVLI
ncbi:radical SAM protein [Parabacteroides distasonis]|nr:radical SAM protein [Parabacteroides distasonis]